MITVLITIGVVVWFALAAFMLFILFLKGFQDGMWAVQDEAIKRNLGEYENPSEKLRFRWKVDAK